MPLQKLRQPKITRFESCDSTNRLLLDAAEAGVPAGSVYVARQQLAGRGRRGRRWISAPDHSLIFSLLWTFPADPVKLQGLSLLVGLAVIRALSDPRLGHAAPETRCGLKWPNDLMLQRHDGSYAKAGGILLIIVGVMMLVLVAGVVVVLAIGAALRIEWGVHLAQRGAEAF